MQFMWPSGRRPGVVIGMRTPTLTLTRSGYYVILDDRILPEYSTATTPEGARREWLGLLDEKGLPEVPVRCGSKIRAIYSPICFKECEHCYCSQEEEE